MNILKNKRILGTHLRIKNSYTQVLEQAHALAISSCQFFFTPHPTHKYLRLSKKDLKSFLKLRQRYFSTIYAHSSYWINGATGNKISERISKNLLLKEISLAQKLAIDHLVLHGGSAKAFVTNPYDPHNRIAGIKAFAKLINSVIKTVDHFTILVENTAHDNKTICSNLQDFIILKTYLSSQVKFCLDTSHAFAYGYNLQDIDSFIQILDHTMGIENIKLIHLNDSKKPCASKLDYHEIPGKGLIGKKILKNLINHKKLKHIPLIIEPPPLPFKELQKVISSFSSWL